MTAPHPAAVGSLGEVAEQWVAEQLKIDLRWWQRLALRRQLEVDRNGEFVWFTIISSTPRRSGKSTYLRALALWRLTRAEQIGEEQLILLSGKDLMICKEIIRRAWPWAEVNGWQTRRANGQEEIESPTGDRWIVRGKQSIYGYDVCLALLDEAWAVEASIIDDGIEPSLLERKQPQLVLTSTAHRQATGLMIDRRTQALAQLRAPTDDLLLMHWGAPTTADVSDRQAWREASPMWTPERERLMARALSRMLAGVDRDLDEPDPIEAFKSQFLNIWPSRMVSSKYWIDPALLEPLGMDHVEVTPLAAALEVSVDGLQWSAAVSDGLGISVFVGRPLSVCLTWLAARGVTEVLVHQAVSHQMPTTLMTRHVTVAEATAAVGVLADAIRGGAVTWDSKEAMTLQLSNVVTAPSTGGVRIADRLSRGPVEAIKAASWAFWMAAYNPIETAAIF